MSSKSFFCLLLHATFLALCLLSGDAKACSCAQPGLESKFASSDNVFTAIITGGEVIDQYERGRSPLKTLFNVTERFKGHVPFKHFRSHADSNTCGISLQVGVEYLIFAPNSGKIGLCSGIMEVSDRKKPDGKKGIRYVSALRAFIARENDSLAEPWFFAEHDGSCQLTGSFPYPELHGNGLVSIYYRYELPVSATPDLDNPYLQSGFTQMLIYVPRSIDLTSFPMKVRLNGATYAAVGREDDGPYRRASYVVNSEDVHSIVADLVNAKEISFLLTHPRLAEHDTKASLINAGDSVLKMNQCMSDTRERP